MGRKVEPKCGGRALFAITGELIDRIVRMRTDRLVTVEQ